MSKATETIRKQHQFNHFARERLLRHDTGVAWRKGGGTFLGRFTYQMTSDIRLWGLVAAQRKSKRIWVWGGVLAVVAAAGLVFSACTEGAHTRAQPSGQSHAGGD